MSWSFRDENNIRAPNNGVLVRRYPFPYQAAVTISNDTDRMRIEAFDDLHDYVNGTSETPYGPGLGLEMSDSFWIWSESRCLSLFHSTPFDKDACLSPEADRIVALAKNGIIDALHNFGQWRVNEYMRRDDSKRALDILDRFGIAPRIWVNHGGDLRMRHQMEGRWGFKRFGDDPDNECYCYDLLRRAGFLFFTHGLMSEQHRLGENRFYRDQGEFDRDLGSFDFQPLFRRYNKLDGSYSNPFGELTAEEEIAVKRKFFNKVLVPETAKDGTPMLLFKRFRGIDRPSAGNFVTQINYYSLRDLVKWRACAIVYQHFGVNRPALSSPSQSSGDASKPPVLDLHNRTAFEYLADFNRRREIWVPAKYRFLEFMRVRDFMDFDVRSEENALSIIIRDLNCPVDGRSKLSVDAINGIAFVLPRTAEQCRIYLGDREITSYFKRDTDNLSLGRPVMYAEYERKSAYIDSSEWYNRAKNR
jgi:hypothetical protein